MELEIRIAKPVAQLADLRVIVIIEMLSGAKDLDQRNARVPNPVEPDGRQAMSAKRWVESARCIVILCIAAQ